MIRYQVSHKELKRLIEAEKSDWLDRAKERTKEFRANGFYREKSSIWSEVKPVYMRLQGNSKCAYCERKLESIDIGKGEQDVEHFRPKSRVKAWKAPKSLKDQGVVFSEVPDEDHGYFLLPYHIFNYSAACKPCNSALKRDYFPIAGDYDLEAESPRKLLKERPYLIYPIGSFDDDPEDLIRFYGTSPHPVSTSSHKRDRALVTIEFFKLDDPNIRKNLFLDRARIIVAIYPQLEKMNQSSNTTKREEAKRLVAAFTSPAMPHTNCARSFEELFCANLSEARAIFDKASELIISSS